jgi:hypothetical protein
MPFEHVRPLIVPAEYVEVGVPAVFDPLPAPDLVLTWVELPHAHTMVYVTPARAAEWNSAHPRWRQLAVEAMRRADRGRVWTHEKRADDGTLEWVAMMHDDGLGSSRLLLEPELRRAFPDGYLVALPDRSCGMAISRHAARLADVRAMVAGMQAKATTPMIPDLREPAQLSSPTV